MAPSAHELESAAADAFASIHITARRSRRGDGTVPRSRPSLASPVKLPRDGPASPDFPPRMLQDVVLSTDSRSSSVELAGVATGGARADAPPPGFTSAAAFDTGAAFSNPLFSNPLFADSSLSIMDLDDASLARIFGKLLDPEYPNAGALLRRPERLLGPKCIQLVILFDFVTKSQFDWFFGWNAAPFLQSLESLVDAVGTAIGGRHSTESCMVLLHPPMPSTCNIGTHWFIVCSVVRLIPTGPCGCAACRHLRIRFGGGAPCATPPLPAGRPPQRRHPRPHGHDPRLPALAPHRTEPRGEVRRRIWPGRGPP